MARSDGLPRPGSTLEDSAGRTHVLGEVFTTASGFGVIYRTTEPHTLVKVFKKDLDVPGLLQRQRSFSLGDLNVVVPSAALEPPYSGYVMRAALNGNQWSDFNDTTRATATTVWLQGLTRLVETVARLHQRGLVFGDLNPRNVLVSSDGRDAVLVDLDTMAREGRTFDDPRIQGARVPELRAPGFTGEHSWASEDVWTMAKDLTRSRGADDPPEAAIFPRAASRMFGADARPRDPDDLPTALDLWRALAHDHDRLLTCWRCGVATQGQRCPECHQPLADASLSVEGPHGRWLLRLSSASGTDILRRHVLGGPSREADAGCGTAEVCADGILVAMSDVRTLVPFGGARAVDGSGITLQLTARKTGP